MNENEAAEELAVIRQERLAAAERLGATGPLPVAAAVVMGAATAALAIHGTVVVAVSTVVFMIGLLIVFGTSARAGMVPRDSLRSTARIFLGAMTLLAVFAVGLTGQQLGLRWLPVVAGVLALAAALGVVRWWRGGLRRELLTGEK